MSIMPERFNSTSAPKFNSASAPSGIYRFWGSECTDCGNTTPGSMCCDECMTNNYTKALWIQP